MTIQFLHRILDSISDFIPVSGVPCTYYPRYSQIPWDASFVCLEITVGRPPYDCGYPRWNCTKRYFFCQVPPRFSFKRVSCYLQCNVVDSSLGESILWESASKSSSCCSILWISNLSSHKIKIATVTNTNTTIR